MRPRPALLVLPALLAAGFAATFALAAADRPASTVVVKSATNATLGKRVLVTGAGLTLYRNKRETAGRVRCTGGCASVWPPLTLPTGVTRATAGTGVAQVALGKVKRPDGRWQVTYKRQPLYRYAADRKPGQAGGEGIGGIWFVLAAGPSATVTTGTTTASTSTSSSPPPYPTYP